MAGKRNLEGAKFGTITVLKKSENKDSKHKHVVWIGECDNCGSIKDYISPDLLSGTRISCGCIGNIAGSGSPYWQGCGELSKTKFNKIKEIANRREINFELTLDYMWNLYLQQ